MDYVKYVYWLDEVEAAGIVRSLEDRDHFVTVVKKAVCIPLTKNFEVGLVPPQAWREFQLCRRQFSWYENSRFDGRFLLISDFDLKELGPRPETIIRERSDFRPPRRPDEAEMRALVEGPAYQRARPAAWENVTEKEQKILVNWLARAGGPRVSFGEIFLSHCANHANFIEPMFFIDGENGPVPYSIAPTAGVCSACLELYNILGGDFKRKLVTPCPGAVLYGRLKLNKYYEVLRPGVY